MLWILQATFEFYKVTSPSLSVFQTLGCHRSSRVEMCGVFPRPLVGSRFTGTVWNSFPLWNSGMVTWFGTCHQNLHRHGCG